ncbi:MAG: Cysteine desulfurase SufS [Candidatus Anoxychlamydiales bacterium]|nr:Cysteine desulfurase SufS [Candidatus Anoxychlamydiales bacterium]
MNLKKYRELFPISQKGCFLNHAATAPVSYATINSMKVLCDQMQEPLGKHFYESLGILEHTRRLLAELLSANAGEIAFTPNTSTALSLIALAIDWKPGDRILVPRNEFPSNRYIWQNLKSKGVKCEFFDLDHPLSEVLESLDLSSVKLISISLVSYLSGQRHDINAFGAFCRKHDILSCVDAIQAVGTIPVDVHQADIDFLAGGAQKWLLGPMGCGYLYIRKDLIPKLHVPLVGWTSVRYPENFDLMQLDFSPEATRFEPGLLNIASIGGFKNSLEELKSIGWKFIYQRIQNHSIFLREGIKQISGITLKYPHEKYLSGITSFDLPKHIHPKKFQASLEKEGITVTMRNSTVRVSPHFYNTQEELLQFLYTIDKNFQKKRLFLPKEKKEKLQTDHWVLINGVTGTLGKEIALSFAQKGYNILGIGRNQDILKTLKNKIEKNYSLQFEFLTADLKNSCEVSLLIEKLKQKSQRYDALINCSGIAYAGTVSSIDTSALQDLIHLNTIIPAEFMRQFMQTLKSDKAIGILNIISPSGRFSLPLLGPYGATHAALWTLGESLQYELTKESQHVTTFVSPPMHSPMQKTIGRQLLRYFSLSGKFNYSHAEAIAKQAVDAFLAKKSLVLTLKMRIMLLLNLFFPQWIKSKIRKKWKREEK